MQGFWHPEIDRQNRLIIKLLEESAVREEQSGAREQQTLRNLDKIYRLLAGPVTTGIVITAETDGTAVTVGPPSGGNMAQTVAATVDNTTVTLVASPEDDHNDPTPDVLTWTNDDTAGAFAAWVLSADTHTYTGTLTHAEGTVNITVTDPAAPALSPTVVTLTIGPGATSQLNVTATVV